MFLRRVDRVRSRRFGRSVADSADDGADDRGGGDHQLRTGATQRRGIADGRRVGRRRRDRRRSATDWTPDCVVGFGGVSRPSDGRRRREGASGRARRRPTRPSDHHHRRDVCAAAVAAAAAIWNDVERHDAADLRVFRKPARQGVALYLFPTAAGPSIFIHQTADLQHIEFTRTILRQQAGHRSTICTTEIRYNRRINIY